MDGADRRRVGRHRRLAGRRPVARRPVGRAAEIIAAAGRRHRGAPVPLRPGRQARRSSVPARISGAGDVDERSVRSLLRLRTRATDFAATGIADHRGRRADRARPVGHDRRRRRARAAVKDLAAATKERDANAAKLGNEAFIGKAPDAGRRQGARPADGGRGRDRPHLSRASTRCRASQASTVDGAERERVRALLRQVEAEVFGRGARAAMAPTTERIAGAASICSANRSTPTAPST